MASNSQEFNREDNRAHDESSSNSSTQGASSSSSSAQGSRPVELRPSVRFQNPPESQPTMSRTASYPRHSVITRLRRHKPSSPLSSPPLEATMEEPEDYFSVQSPTRSPFESPPVFVTDSDGEQRNLTDMASNRSRTQHSAGVQLKDNHSDDSESESEYNEESATRSLLERNASLEVPPSAQINDHMSIANNPLQNLFDMGLYTSGGLAPGGNTAKYTSDGTGDDLKKRREHLLRSIGVLKKPDEADQSETEAEIVGPFGKGNNKDDIELLELDKKLSEQIESAEAKDIAEHLVRTHTLHKRHHSSAASSATGTGYDAKDGYVVSTNDYLLPSQDVMYSYDSAAGLPENNGPPDERQHEEYVAPPQHVKQGVLGSLLKLYAHNEASKSQNTLYSETPGVQSPKSSPSRPSTPVSDPGLLSPPKHPLSIGRPKLKQTKSTEHAPTVKRPKWYEHKQSRSMSSLGGLVLSASQTLAAPGGGGAAESPFPERPSFVKRYSGGVKVKKKKKNKKKTTLEEQIRITVHIADVLQRQRFLLRLCRALMLYGAPTHRLEEYMKMTSRVLEINGQYLYIPGCMIVSFGDATTHTSEMQLVRCVQGLNLDKLHQVHQIYKEVVHDIINVEEASERIDELLAGKNRYPDWLCVIFFGLASAMVTPFAFKGWWADMPISFLLGGAVGVLQVIVAPRSDLYNNVFEVTSSIVVSFLGRAFGSIGKPEHHTFCFSGIAQGSLALILPGYMVLTGSLELQSKNIVPGSVRMFYAVVYSIFLGFGITLGAAIYGWIDSNATSEITCRREVSQWFLFLLVPAFTAFLAAVNQATIRQMPIMVIIGSAGYAVTYFIQRRVSNSNEFTTAIGAFVIGIMGNVYSRVGHGLAFAAMLPGIFVQLPGGVAAQGSLVAGIKNADLLVGNLTRNRNSTTTGTAVAVTTTADGSISAQQNNAMSLGITMIQVCVGITVGLFVATLVIYPFGKKRSGLFTF